ncbi:related to maleylacetate reductase [Fusarium fujikuroi]|uniref:Related to maleylacetate reductase n=2 Tax=Fusarium fujikuroi TaxID=5127 RepID=S0DSE2_GIBF5|nr:related to maleylacetate reductase [Fusarium fujikuroi IMI 58289]QGI61633.1 hypothetical protein CEK27_005604 [Fusarium fujikuroi]QGI78821.1 hypothetical protein CEK25_005550 [Fusarium fujikuroi]QGI92532.1 hypothetical protein CEK26_005601 [Fusarium fujikuroi]CCT65479.1 related to maleylacetate reductase [Fusarium fujikuroi IMI 58289]SCO13083.1 related to maleylacetate reductase [Fusarium fujikuroi]
MHHYTTVIHRLSPRKVTDPDLVAVRDKLVDALALKASALVTPPATNLSPPSSHAGPPGTVQRPPSRSRHRRPKRSSSSSSSPRLVVGPDAVHRLPSELARLHLSSPLIVSSPSRSNIARKIQAIIPNLDSRVLCSSNTTVPAQASGRDCVISVGGGSAVTLARAVGIRKGIPHICIPTTYSANELHPGGGPSDSSSEEKGSGHGTRILPTVIIYDDNLTMSSPTRFPAPSNEKVMEDFARAQTLPKSEDACWSYLHIPGV